MSSNNTRKSPPPKAQSQGGGSVEKTSNSTLKSTPKSTPKSTTKGKGAVPTPLPKQSNFPPVTQPLLPTKMITDENFARAVGATAAVQAEGAEGDTRKAPAAGTNAAALYARQGSKRLRLDFGGATKAPVSEEPEPEEPETEETEEDRKRAEAEAAAKAEEERKRAEAEAAAKAEEERKRAEAEEEEIELDETQTDIIEIMLKIVKLRYILASDETNSGLNSVLSGQIDILKDIIENDNDYENFCQNSVDTVSQIIISFPSFLTPEGNIAKNFDEKVEAKKETFTYDFDVKETNNNSRSTNNRRTNSTPVDIESKARAAFDVKKYFFKKSAYDAVGKSFEILTPPADVDFGVMNKYIYIDPEDIRDEYSSQNKVDAMALMTSSMGLMHKDKNLDIKLSVNPYCGHMRLYKLPRSYERIKEIVGDEPKDKINILTALGKTLEDVRIPPFKYEKAFKEAYIEVAGFATE